MTAAVATAAEAAAEAADQKDAAAFADISFDANENGNDDLIKIAQNPGEITEVATRRPPTDALQRDGR